MQGTVLTILSRSLRFSIFWYPESFCATESLMPARHPAVIICGRQPNQPNPLQEPSLHPKERTKSKNVSESEDLCAERMLLELEQVLPPRPARQRPLSSLPSMSFPSSSSCTSR